MTKEQLASKLDGLIYRTDFDSKLIDAAQESGLVIGYGASDDLFELEGALTDEGDCYVGEDFLIDKEGLLTTFPEDLDDDDEKMEYLKRKKKAKKITAIWCGKDSVAAWTYRTDIPHSTFYVYEEDDKKEIQCVGIVFELSELK